MAICLLGCVSPGIENQFPRAVKGNRGREVDGFDQVLHCLGFRLGKRFRPVVGVAAGVGAGMGIGSPVVAVVSVQINTERSITVVTHVLPPGLFVQGTFIAVGVEAGDDPDFTLVDQVPYVCPGFVGFEQEVDEVIGHFDREYFIAMVATDEKDCRF